MEKLLTIINMLPSYMMLDLMHSISIATAPRAAVMIMLEPINAPRSPISGRRTKVTKAAAESELLIFRVAEPVVDDPNTSCWLAPDGEGWVCARDADLKAMGHGDEERSF